MKSNGEIIVSKKDEWQCGSGSNQPDIIHKRLIGWVLIAAGTFSVALGILGIFLPILPTTPFLLLAAGCYSRSSQKFYNWLINNKWFGRYIKNYREGRGVSLRSKILIITLLWSLIIFSVFFAVKILLVTIILILIAIGVTIHIIFLRTLKH